MSNTSTHSSTRRLTEGGICIALALVLSYLQILYLVVFVIDVDFFL